MTEVRPQPSASWAVAPQAAGSGGEGGTVVTYRAASPLPEGARGEFELQLRLPDAAGTTLAFPTVQTCESGESAWTEVPAAAELQLPAPTLTLTAGAPGTPAATPSGPAATPEAATSPSVRAADGGQESSQAPGSGGSSVPVAAMAAGAVGLSAGGGLVLRRRRT